MNWLGEKIQKYVEPTDLVLDLGCGIMQATTNIYEGNDNKESLICRDILGVEWVWKYVDKVKAHYPVIRMDVINTQQVFADNSFDVVICLDVIEHLEEREAKILLKEVARISRKYGIIYTPKEFDPNGDNIENAWGMGSNLLQAHKTLINSELLEFYGYKWEVTEIDHNLFGVYHVR